MIYIDKYAYFSELKNANPLLKILFGGLSLIVCVCSESFLSFSVVFVTMFYVTVFKAKIPLGYYVRLLFLPLGFLLLGVLGVVINVTPSSLPPDCAVALNFQGYNIFVSKTGLLTASVLVCKSMSAVSCLYFIILTTPFRTILQFLHLLRCPEILVTLSGLIYSFIFLLMDIADIKLKSQRCRSGYRDIKNFPRTFAMLWGSVFVQAWFKSQWAFKSMQARGYDGRIKYLPQKFRMNVTEIFLLLSFLIFVTIFNFL
jgi:cobalt/nickel transport system permease protein